MWTRNLPQNTSLSYFANNDNDVNSKKNVKSIKCNKVHVSLTHSIPQCGPCFQGPASYLQTINGHDLQRNEISSKYHVDNFPCFHSRPSISMIDRGERTQKISYVEEPPSAVPGLRDYLVHIYWLNCCLLFKGIMKLHTIGMHMSQWK